MTAPTDDEIAAAVAAVRCLLDQEASENTAVVPPRSAWSDAARLLAQDVAPSRLTAPTWGNVERLRRAVRSGRE